MTFNRAALEAEMEVALQNIPKLLQDLQEVFTALENPENRALVIEVLAFIHVGTGEIVVSEALKARIKASPLAGKMGALFGTLGLLSARNPDQMPNTMQVILSFGPVVSGLLGGTGPSGEMPKN